MLVFLAHNRRALSRSRLNNRLATIFQGAGEALVGMFAFEHMTLKIPFDCSRLLTIINSWADRTKSLVVPGRHGPSASSLMPATHSPTQNHLLAALSDAEFERLAGHLELVPMPLGEVLYESGGLLPYVYFPTTSIVSLLYVFEDGASAEIAVVGNDGILGVSVFMGGETTPSRAVVQSAGHGYRLPAQRLKQEFNRIGPMLHLLLRYTQALITQMAQTAVCNRHHSIEQQLCRWLLLSLDRLSSNSLVMTQELIANMLGVRREGVTDAAGHLQRAGLINYSRGHIEVIDRAGLEKAVCECYGVVKLEFDRLLSDIPRVGSENARNRSSQ
jgi:CRP-like cAMP-binding protein